MEQINKPCCFYETSLILADKKLVVSWNKVDRRSERKGGFDPRQSVLQKPRVHSSSLLLLG